MRRDFSSIINSHTGKTGFVCGMGPSLGGYLNKFSLLSKNKKKNTFICCNDFDLVTEILADFWMVASSVITIPKMYDRFNNHKKTTLVYADSVDTTEAEIVEQLLTVDYIPYDQRHFRGLRCPELLSHSYLTNLGGYDPEMKCCSNFRQETIQECLKRITEYDKHYGTGETVALHMLALAIILGLNPIYIVGVELDYSKGYVDNKITNNDTFEHWMPNLMRDFSIINESAQKIGVNIINLSQESKLSTIMKTDKNIIT